MLQVRAVTMSSYVDVARSVGLNGRALLKEFGIKEASLGEPENRLPARAVAALLDSSAQRSGCEDFGLRMAACRSYASIGGLALLLQHLETVRDALLELIKLRRGLSDVGSISLQECDGTALIRFELIPEIASVQGSDLQTALGLLILAGASQQSWMPDCVHLTRSRPADARAFMAFFSCPVEFDSTFNGYSCTSSSLSMRLPLADPIMASNAARLLNIPTALPSKSVTPHVTQSIALLLPSSRASLSEVAQNLDVSERSLQRRLSLEGQTFGELVNQVRRQLALRSLANASRSVTDVAADLGFWKLSSFSRWFTTEFGMSATQWRLRRARPIDGPPPIWKL